jgi:hypothetical protein
MTRSESEEVKHKDYDTEVLMINPQGKQLHWPLYWQVHYRACPLSYIPSKRYLLMEMVNQMAFSVSIKTENSNGVCVRKIRMQRIMSDGGGEAMNMSNLAKQIGHFTVPESVVGFNAP